MKATLHLLTTLLSAVVSSSAALDSGAASSFITNELSDVLGSSEDPTTGSNKFNAQSIHPTVNNQSLTKMLGACISQAQQEAAGQFCSSSDTSGASTPDHATNCLLIMDESECTAAIDSTTSSNENCSFCNFPE
eukprot:scaffold1064_cov209-Skeletonema_marinoi.AAC.1